MMQRDYRNSPWPAGDALLIALWQADESVADIGRRMNLSKNAIIGRAHRLQEKGLLLPRDNPVGRTGQQPPKKAPPARRDHPATALPALISVPAPVALPKHSATGAAYIAPPAAIDPTPAPAPSITARCAWPTWTEKDAAYWSALHEGAAPSCGKPVMVRRADGVAVACSYCVVHHAVAFTRAAHGYASNGMLRRLIDAPPAAHGPAKVRAYA